MGKEQQPTNLWIERHFIPECPIRTPGQFIELVYERMEQLKRLPETVLHLRETVRGEFGIAPDTPWLFLGEQAVGLNEPPLIIGKRVLAASLASKKLPSLHYYANADVVGSEPGLHRSTLPDPRISKGIRYVSWLSADNFKQIPSMNIGLDKINLESVSTQLSQIYNKYDRGFRAFLGDLWYETLPPFSNADNNYATLMNHLLGRLLHEWGITGRKTTNDVYFDSLVAQKGGLDLILELWPEIVNLSNKYKELWPNVRIPEINVAPFYAYPKGCQIRPITFFDNERDGCFNAVSPFNPDEIIGAFNLEKIKLGEVGVTFRAIPRVLLLALIFDGHITGGGAGYNRIAGEVFKELWGVDYFPLVWMDLGSQGQLKGIFQYPSAALKNKGGKGLSGYETALTAVKQGLVSSLDLYLSVPPSDVRKAINEQVFNNPDFSMATRIFLE